MRFRVWDGLKEDLGVANVLMDGSSKSQGVPWSVDVRTFYQMTDSVIEHVENR
jgi:hypothetical protein